MTTEQILLFVVLAAYAVATVWSELGVVAPGRFRAGVSTVLAAIGLVVHTVALGMLASRMGRLPMSNPYEVLSLLLWLAAALYLALQLSRPLRGLGAFYLPLVTALAVVVAALASGAGSEPGGRSIIAAVHGGAALLGFAAFALAAAVAMMFLIQDGALKSHRMGRLWSLLPSVRQLERITYGAVGFGFIFLTISLGLGIYLAGRLRAEWATQHTVLLSILTWLVFAVLLHLRLTSAWRGRKIAYFTITGFALVTAVFAVLLFTSDALHGFFS